ncbi:MAG TPA: hypothetical protein VIK78_00230, partial [Ruminiclostridium sp.]
MKCSVLQRLILMDGIFKFNVMEDDIMENVKLKRTLKTKDLVVFGLVFMIPLAPAGMYGTYL